MSIMEELLLVLATSTAPMEITLDRKSKPTVINATLDPRQRSSTNP